MIPIKLRRTVQKLGRRGQTVWGERGKGDRMKERRKRRRESSILWKTPSRLIVPTPRCLQSVEDEEKEEGGEPVVGRPLWAHLTPCISLTHSPHHAVKTCVTGLKRLCNLEHCARELPWVEMNSEGGLRVGAFTVRIGASAHHQSTWEVWQEQVEGSLPVLPIGCSLCRLQLAVGTRPLLHRTLRWVGVF